MRANSFRELYGWLNHADLLIVKSDRREPLVILRLKFAAEIAAIAEGRKAGNAKSLEMQDTVPRHNGDGYQGNAIKI